MFIKIRDKNNPMEPILLDTTPVAPRGISMVYVQGQDTLIVCNDGTIWNVADSFDEIHTALNDARMARKGGLS